MLIQVLQLIPLIYNTILIWIITYNILVLDLLSFMGEMYGNLLHDKIGRLKVYLMVDKIIGQTPTLIE